MDDLEARVRGEVPTFAERFDEFDERLENGMRIERGKAAVRLKMREARNEKTSESWNLEPMH